MPLDKLRVLVADDASFIRDLIKRAIRGPYPNFQIEDAVNGRKAQSLLKSGQFDLVLCDWEMPEMTGLELLQWFRQQDKYKKTPFMMVTSRGDKGHVIEAVQAGVSEYIGKPFSNEQLLNKLTKLVYKYYKIQPNSGGASPAAASMDSVSALTQKTVAPKQASKPKVQAASASLLTGSSASEKAMTEAAAPIRKKASASNKILGQAQIRLASGAQFASAIKDINLTEVLVLAKRTEPLPQLFEQAVMDIETTNGNMERINGYVHMVQSNGNGMDANAINVLIRYVDQDPEKLAQLSRFIASVR